MAKTTTTKPAPKPTTAATTAPAPSAKAAATGVTSTATATPTATKASTLTVATPKPAASTCCGGHTTCATPSYEQVAQRAYEIWVAKGRPQGQDIENWKQAEADLKRGSRVNAA